jgi:hypothetical protein
MLLTMSAPMRCENTIEFLLEPGIGGTGVTWAMVGRELQRGLAALGAQAEAAGAAKAA